MRGRKRQRKKNGRRILDQLLRCQEYMGWLGDRLSEAVRQRSLLFDPRYGLVGDGPDCLIQIQQESP